MKLNELVLLHNNYYLVTDGYQKPFMAYRVSKTELLKWIQDCRKGGNGKN